MKIQSKMWAKSLLVALLASVTFYLAPYNAILSFLGRNEGQKLVVILAGTGQQGMGAIEYLIEHDKLKQFKIRTLTRNTKSDAAKQLESWGVEVFQGESTVKEDLDRTFQGAYAVFGVTFSDFEGGKELSHGKILGDAAQQAGVQYLVFSGGEKTNIPLFDVKFDIEQHIRSLDIPRTVFLHTCFFYENLVTKKGTKRVEVGQEGLIFCTPLPPNLKIPMISSRDIGRIAAVAILYPDRFQNGESVPIAGDVVSCDEFVSSFKKHSGLNASYVVDSLEEFEKKPFPGAKEIAEMYRWYIREGHSRDVSRTKRVFPQVQSLEEWMQRDGVESINSQVSV